MSSIAYPFDTYVKYGTDENDLNEESEPHPIQPNSNSAGENQEHKVQQLKNLKQNTAYYYCAVAKNDYGEASATVGSVQTLGLYHEYGEWA